MRDLIEMRGRLVQTDAVVRGRVLIEDGFITAVEHEDQLTTDLRGPEPLIAPGFVDVHVHGWGGHDAMGGVAELAAMAGALARRGVTSFLPTAVSAPIERLVAFATSVKAWSQDVAVGGAAPLGYNLEGPFLAPSRRGAHDPDALLSPSDVDAPVLAPLLDGLRLITVAPELSGAIDLIRRLRRHGVVVSLGHSAATLDEASAGYDAGATGTTHLFNAMTGIDHRAPGLAVAALMGDDAFVEVIADGQHVHPALLRLIWRTKRPAHVVLVSDAIALGGLGDGRTRLGSLDVEVSGGRATLAGTATLAGSVIALDDAVRTSVAAGIPLPSAIAAASTYPLALIGQTDRGRIAVGQRADLVELDEGLAVRSVWLAGRRLDA